MHFFGMEASSVQLRVGPPISSPWPYASTAVGIAPHARRHALFSKQARSACPIDIPNWPAEPKLDRAKVDPRGRTRTCTLEGLSFVPLHWATRGLVPTIGFAPILCAF